MDMESRLADDSLVAEILSTAIKNDTTGVMMAETLQQIYSEWYQRNVTPESSEEVGCVQQKGPSIVQLLLHTSGLPGAFKANPDIEADVEEELAESMQQTYSGDYGAMSEPSSSQSQGFQAVGIPSSSVPVSDRDQPSSSSSAELSEEMLQSMSERQVQEFAAVRRMKDDVKLLYRPGTMNRLDGSQLETVLVNMLIFRLAGKSGLIDTTSASFEDAISAASKKAVDVGGDSIAWNAILDNKGEKLVEFDSTSILSSADGAWSSFEQLEKLSRSFIASSHGSSVQNLMAAYRVGIQKGDLSHFAALGSLGKIVGDRFTLFYNRGGVPGMNFAGIFWVPEMGLWGCFNIDSRSLKPGDVDKSMKEFLQALNASLVEAADSIGLPEMAAISKPKINMPACYEGRPTWRHAEAWLASMARMSQQPSMVSSALLASPSSLTASRLNMSPEERKWWSSVKSTVHSGESVSTRFVHPFTGHQQQIALQVNSEEHRVVDLVNANNNTTIASVIYDRKNKPFGPKELLHDGTIGDPVQFFQKPQDSKSAGISSDAAKSGSDSNPILGFRGVVFYDNDAKLDNQEQFDKMVSSQIDQGSTFAQSLGSALSRSSPTSDASTSVLSHCYNRPSSVHSLAVEMPSYFFDNSAGYTQASSSSAEQIGLRRGGRGGRGGRRVTGRTAGRRVYGGSSIRGGWYPYATRRRSGRWPLGLAAGLALGGLAGSAIYPAPYCPYATIWDPYLQQCVYQHRRGIGLSLW
jgi:hypothetical protein